MRVYYLDDEPALCNIFCDAFTTDEIEIVCFTDAQEAIAACEAKPPVAIFIDMRLQDTTGDVVARAISDSIRKFLVTGDLVNTSDYPFEQVIAKPLDLMLISNLLETIKSESA